MQVALQSVTATSATLTFSDVPGGAVLVEVQYAFRHDFQWCLAPIVRTNSTAGMTLSGLNQAGRYFIRARAILGDASASDWSAPIGAATPVAGLRSLAPANIMIEPGIIVPQEPVLAWAADNESDGYPVRALGRDDPNSSWWATRGGAYFAFEARLSGAPIDTIAVLETNAAEDATIRIKAGANQANVQGGAPTFSTVEAPFRASALLPGRRAFHSLVRLPAAQSYPYWRIEIGGTVPGNLFVATYAHFGLAHSTKNFAVDSKSEILLEGGTIDRDRSGNPARVAGHRGRTVEFEVQQMTEAQYEGQFEQLRWLTGATDPALVVPNMKAGAFLHDRILYGQLAPSRATNTYSPRFTQQFSVNSLI